MKLQETMKGRFVLILIDSGASHNLVSRDLVTLPGLQMEITSSYCVRLGDGQKK